MVNDCPTMPAISKAMDTLEAQVTVNKVLGLEYICVQLEQNYS